MVNRQFTTSFAFLIDSEQWSGSTENWTSTLSEFQQHPFCNFVPDSLWSVLFDRVPLFLRTKTKERPLSFSKTSCIQRYESDICPTFFFIAFCSTRNVVEHRHKKRIFLWIFLVLLPICTVNFWLLHWAATCWILGKYSTRISSAHRRFCQSFCNFEKIWSVLIFAPMHR